MVATTEPLILASNRRNCTDQNRKIIQCNNANSNLLKTLTSATNNYSVKLITIH